MAEEHLAAVRDLVFEALPDLDQAQLVELLEFIATQHSGYNYSADNGNRAKDIAAFLARAPFAVSKTGVEWCAATALALRAHGRGGRCTQLARIEKMAASPSSPAVP